MKIIIVMTVLAWSLPTSAQAQIGDEDTSLENLISMEKHHQRNLTDVVKGKKRNIQIIIVLND